MRQVLWDGMEMRTGAHSVLGCGDVRAGLEGAVTALHPSPSPSPSEYEGLAHLLVRPKIFWASSPLLPAWAKMAILELGIQHGASAGCSIPVPVEGTAESVRPTFAESCASQGGLHMHVHGSAAY